MILIWDLIAFSVVKNSSVRWRFKKPAALPAFEAGKAAVVTSSACIVKPFIAIMQFESIEATAAGDQPLMPVIAID